MSDSTWIFTYVGIAADWPTMHWLIARDGALRGMWLRPSRRIDWVGAEPVLKELGIEKSKEKVAKLAQLTQRFQEERNHIQRSPPDLNVAGGISIAHRNWVVNQNQLDLKVLAARSLPKLSGFESVVG